jgi:hypothetical protein
MDASYFAAEDLAGQPGMPKHPRSVHRKAEKDGWDSLDVAGKGGRNGTRRLYHISSLPPETRKALAAAHPAKVAPLDASGTETGRKLALSAKTDKQTQRKRAEDALQRAAHLPEREHQRAADREAILADWQQYRRLSGESIKPSLASYADLYNTGRREGMETVRQRIRKVSQRTMLRWRRDIKERGHLGANYGRNKGANKIDSQPELRDFVVAMLTAHPHCKASQAMQGLEARFAGREDIDLPSQGRLGKWMNVWKEQNAQLFSAVSNPDAWKNQYMTAFGSASEQITVMNQLWEFDGTPADIMFTDGRHSICGVIDVYTRRPKMLVTPTAKATAVAALLRRSLLDWGLPSAPWRLTAKTDNGSDYKGHHMRRVFELLDIHQELCPPFSPWHKPHIERFFRSFSHDLVELLPGFIGHNVADRKGIEARKAFSDRLFKKDTVIEVNMSSEEFQRFCDDWITDIYMHRPHDGLNGKTPYQMVTEWKEPVERISNERALDLLLSEAPGKGLRTVSKKGIRLDHGLFIAPELWSVVDQEVRVLYDPIDLGRIMVYGGEQLNEFVCVAECPERTGIDRAEVAAKAHEIQKKTIQEARAELKHKANKLGVDDIVTEIRATAAAKASKLTSLPRPSREYTSDGLEAAAEAARSLDIATSRQKLTADISTPEASYARWKKLEARQKAGETLYEEDAAFFKSFAQTADWRAMQRLEEDFGEFYLAHQ